MTPFGLPVLPPAPPRPQGIPLTEDELHRLWRAEALKAGHRRGLPGGPAQETYRIRAVDRARAVHAILAEGGSYTIGAITARMGGGETAIRDALDGFVAQGLVRREVAGKRKRVEYSIAEAEGHRRRA